MTFGALCAPIEVGRRSMRDDVDEARRVIAEAGAEFRGVAVSSPNRQLMIGFLSDEHWTDLVEALEWATRSSKLTAVRTLGEISEAPNIVIRVETPTLRSRITVDDLDALGWVAVHIFQAPGVTPKDAIIAKLKRRPLPAAPETLGQFSARVQDALDRAKLIFRVKDYVITRDARPWNQGPRRLFRLELGR